MRELKRRNEKESKRKERKLNASYGLKHGKIMERMGKG